MSEHRSAEWWRSQPGVYAVDALIDDLAACERERDEVRETVARLNRRCQTAEAEVKALREELADYRAYYEYVKAWWEPHDSEAMEIVERIEARRAKEVEK